MKVLVAGRLSVKADDRDQTGFDSQEREAIRWAEQNGHTVVGVAADYKSGRSDMMDRRNLRPWVTDPAKIGEYDAIIALKLDRLTRGDTRETRRLEQWANDNGKELLITNGLRYPCEGTDGAMWDFAKRQAHQEWLDISERYTRMQRTLRHKGSAVGRPPWGYEIVQRDGLKVFAPTDDGRNYVPAIYQRIVDGHSLRAVAVWLDSRGVTTQEGHPWNEGTIGNRLIKNPVYYGARRNGGNLETEALVSYSLWAQANAALASRARTGRGTVTIPKALLSPVCGNPNCDATGEGPSPMYRISSGRGASRAHFYRCTGRGPQRKGCGNMVSVAELDALVSGAMADDSSPYRDRVFVPGDSRADEIGKLREAAMTAYRAGDKARFLALDAEADALEAMPAELPHWAERETGETVGQHWATLDAEAQRAYLARGEVRAFHTADLGVFAHWRDVIGLSRILVSDAA